MDEKEFQLNLERSAERLDLVGITCLLRVTFFYSLLHPVMC